MKEKYLPIGTVVLLKGGKKRAMITGFCSVAQENQQKIYDYSGCVYPEGYLSSNQVCLFDHDQIEKIFFEGFVDEEEIQFKEKLNRIVSNLEKERAPESTETVEEMSEVSQNTDVSTAEPAVDTPSVGVTETVVDAPNINVGESIEDYGDIRPFGE